MLAIRSNRSKNENVFSLHSNNSLRSSHPLENATQTEQTQVLSSIFHTFLFTCRHAYASGRKRWTFRPFMNWKSFQHFIEFLSSNHLFTTNQFQLRQTVPMWTERKMGPKNEKKTNVRRADAESVVILNECFTHNKKQIICINSRQRSSMRA